MPSLEPAGVGSWGGVGEYRGISKHGANMRPDFPGVAAVRRDQGICPDLVGLDVLLRHRQAGQR